MSAGRAIAAALLALAAVPGCAAERRIVRTEAGAMVAAPAPGPAAVRPRPAARTAQEENPRGVLSTTVHFIGEILAMPFRLAGALVRAVF